MQTTLEDVRETFEMLDDWADRYGFLIELGRELSPYPESLRDDAHKVKGCQSQVWLNATIESGRLSLSADSDAHIARGMVALVCLIFDNKSPEAVIEIDAKPLLAELGLDQHLTPGRSNGLHAMIQRIKTLAARAPQIGRAAES